MDLKLKEVCELLNVSKATIKRWISYGKVPYYKLHNQYRFSRNEIENWVLSCKQDSKIALFDEEQPTKEFLGTHQFGLFRAVHRGAVYENVEGSTKEDLIRNSMNLIAKDLSLDAEVITDLLLDRENLMPTALSNGIAVPHTRDFLLQEAYDVIAVVFPKEPIEYGALDNKPVHTLFFLFACDDKRHLNLLAKLAHLSSKPENLDFLLNQPDKKSVLDFIKSWESNINPKSPDNS